MRGRGTGTGKFDGYERRRPEGTLLYPRLEEHWPTFLEKADEGGGSPRFVECDLEECADVLDAFLGALMRSLRRRAKRELGLRSVEDARAGAVTFVQRSDGSRSGSIRTSTRSLFTPGTSGARTARSRSTRSVSRAARTWRRSPRGPTRPRARARAPRPLARRRERRARPDR